MNGLDLNKLESKANRKRRHSMNFLKNIGKIKIKNIDFREKIKKYSFGLDNSKKVIDDELDLQKVTLYENMKVRRSSEKRRKQLLRPSVNDLIDNFIKTFHLNYIVKVIPRTIELTLQSILENYSQQIQITSDYNDKIKEFEMLKMLEECKIY
jgi:hypothetical protein